MQNNYAGLYPRFFSIVLEEEEIRRLMELTNSIDSKCIVEI